MISFAGETVNVEGKNNVSSLHDLEHSLEQKTAEVYALFGQQGGTIHQLTAKLFAKSKIVDPGTTINKCLDYLLNTIHCNDAKVFKNKCENIKFILSVGE